MKKINWQLLPGLFILILGRLLTTPKDGSYWVFPVALVVFLIAIFIPLLWRK